MGNYEAELAKDVAYEFECKKDAFSQLTSGTMKIVLTINPDDMNMEFIKDAMGQRYKCFLVPLNDDETPRINEEPVQKPKSFATQAKMMAKDEDFIDFCVDNGQILVNNALMAEDWIESYCQTDSCAHLKENTFAGNRFKELQREFNNWKRARQQEEHYKR